MREQGRLTDWNDSRGFGYITPLHGGATVFVHISEFPRDKRRPCVTDLLTYEVGTDDRGRAHAVGVQFLSAAHARSSRPGPRSTSPISIPVVLGGTAFLIGVLAAAALRTIPNAVAMAYLGMSVVTFIAYAIDKEAAELKQWRTRESTLIVLGLLCGWPGAAVAQEILRHKTRKQPFRTVFWVSVGVNIIVLVWLGATSQLSMLS